ncbi:MAG: hypothetical protein CMJ59_00610 [Planctomycetaceae bacterium]|nr:hypothetical protein [Planctomycetaceae bacterium]
MEKRKGRDGGAPMAGSIVRAESAGCGPTTSFAFAADDPTAPRKDAAVTTERSIAAPPPKHLGDLGLGPTAKL